MSSLLVVEPLPLSSIAARGSGADNLATADPKEVWADSNAGGTALLSIDLGVPASVDTVFLGYLRQASADATWTITGGIGRGDEFIVQSTGPLRVPDIAGHTAKVSHALWFGQAHTFRYLQIGIVQPPTLPPLTAGVLVIGRAFVATLGQEWGSGRRPIDMGSATALSSGGFAMVEGARKRAFSWTFGDLTVDEADRLELLALSVGETRPVLVVEDAARTAGLASRIHYAKFDRWKTYERRNRVQTRWDIGVEEWT